MNAVIFSGYESSFSIRDEKKDKKKKTFSMADVVFWQNNYEKSGHMGE